MEVQVLSRAPKYMKFFLKEHWFKTGLLVLGICYLILFGYSQYLATKVHVLEVLNQLLHCALIPDQDSVKACSSRAKSTLIFSGALWGKLE